MDVTPVFEFKASYNKRSWDEFESEKKCCFMFQLLDSLVFWHTSYKIFAMGISYMSNFTT